MDAKEELTRLKDLPANDRRIIRGWCIFDWANSAFATSGAAAIFPVYFVMLFNNTMSDETSLFGLNLTGSSIWSFGVAISTAIVALSSPILGVISDRVAIKKTLLFIYTVVGSIFTIMAFFSAYTSEPWAWLIVAFTLGNIGFAGSLVFYNALLPHVSPSHLLDDVSSRGFAYGYIGGGLLLAIHLAFITAFSGTELTDLITRICIGSVGVWWFGWSIWTFKIVPEPIIANPIDDFSVKTALQLAFSELKKTFNQLSRFGPLLGYLGAYLLFNDGIQTVLAIAGAFAADTLGISLIFNMTTILIIQFIAAPGAMFFAWLANRLTTKLALMIALAAWCIIVPFGVGIVPLTPTGHEEFDYQFKYDRRVGSYLVTSTPNLSDSERDGKWISIHGSVATDDLLTISKTASIATATAESDLSRFSLSVVGGPLDGTKTIGPQHPSSIGEGPIDQWPLVLRSILWKPLDISSNFQWLILGTFVGIVLGGSQALSRSLFAQMVPDGKSGEFFSFFGFMSRASSVFGPMLYMLVTIFFDTRVAIMSILIIIALGTIALRFVDVEKGRIAAKKLFDNHNHKSGQAN